MLHRRNILHRDIKPENLLRGDDGELRLLDFGLAYCPGLSQDEAHSLPGTPSYIAPEAFDGAAPAARQDLYAAGVTLYRSLTGHYPFGEIEAFQRPRFGTPTPASRYRPDLPAWLDECLARALASEPTQRYETAEQWLLALEQGERKALAVKPRPLLEREPLKVWRGIALLSCWATWRCWCSACTADAPMPGTPPRSGAAAAPVRPMQARRNPGKRGPKELAQALQRLGDNHKSAHLNVEMALPR